MVNIGIEIWGGVFCLVCLICCILAPYLTPRQRTYTKAMFTFCALTLIGDAIGGIGDGQLDPLSLVAVRAGNFVSFCNAPLLVCSYCLFEMDFLETARGKKNPWSIVLIVLCAAVIVLVIVSQFTGQVYYIDEANCYNRGPLLQIPSCTEIFMAVITFIILFANRQFMEKSTIATFALAIALPTVGGILQVAVYGIAWGFIAFVFSALLLFLSIQNEGARHYIQREEQLADSRSKVMLSQIQPHFLFNALNSIQYLCRTDPREASKSVATFSTFLRGNMDALNGEDLIPFDKELEHVQAYLSLEKLRFHEDLSIEWDIQETDFHIPPLTVETLTENAVKHGIRHKESRSGTIRISSCKTDEYYEVAIEDNGVGFDVNAPVTYDNDSGDASTHVGLDNARTRLGLLQKADLLVESEIGVGSKMTIRIPLEYGASRNKD